jgi:hypothetical protein
LSENLPEWVLDFNKQVLDFYDRVVALRDNPLVDSKLACEVLVAISHMKSGLAETYSEMEKTLIGLLEDRDPVTATDGSVVEKVYDKSRKAWKHAEIAEIVADRIQKMSIDLDTGEIQLSTKEMITKLLDFAGISYWKVTTLREIGVDADDYCESGEFVPKISLRKDK